MFKRSPAICLSLIAASFLCHDDAVAHDDHHEPLRGAIYPKLSPDGETIAFAYQGSIWRVPRQG